MATVSPLPAVVGVEDFAFHSEEAGTPLPHSREETFSSPPAPPLSTALSPDTRDYGFSSNIYDDYAASRSTSAHEDEYTTEEDDLDHLHAPAVAQSTRSSVSSFPGSVLPDPRQYGNSTLTKAPNPLSGPDVLHHGRSGSLSYKIRSPASRLRDSDRNIALERNHGTGFRNPSSVRAMQMRDDDPFDSGTEATLQHRRSGSRMSNFSRRSGNASPTKRPSRSNHSTPYKAPSPSKLKKEFPLVLLHCSVLPPALALKSHITDEALLEEILPAEYWRRWKILQDKIGEDNEVRSRGVLIPHPRDDYDVLEERLLESLELERPRLRKGHYIGGDIDSGLGTESERDTENESDFEDQSTKAGPNPPKCPDCGKRVPQETEVDRKWEVKVYAANGLMRAGAWAAAWSEMEKVDVEVSVWIPEGVRREVDGRLKELGMFDDENIHHDHENGFHETEEERRQREIYGRPSHGQDTIDGLSDGHSHSVLSEAVQQSRGLHSAQSLPQADLQTLALNYVRGAMQDRRNIFMALLSILILFLAMSKPQTTKELALSQPSVQSGAATSEMVTSVSILTSTEVVTATVTATTTPSLASESNIPFSSLAASSAEEYHATLSTEYDETSTTTSTKQTESTAFGADAPEATAFTASAGEEEPPVMEHEEPALLEQVVQILAGDDQMIE